MNILMTGGTGFIGQHLRARLRAEGHQLILMTHSESVPETELGEEWVSVELGLDPYKSALKRTGLLRDIDAIVHLSRDPISEAYLRLHTDVAGTWELLDFASSNNVPRFYYASCGQVYKPTDTPHLESGPVAPTDLESGVKIASEAAVQTFPGRMKRCIWRIFDTYGPGQKPTRGVIPYLIDEIVHRRAIALRTGGRSKHNFLYIDDLIEAMARSIQLKYEDLPNHLMVNLAGLEEISIREAANIIGKVVGEHVGMYHPETSIASHPELDQFEHHLASIHRTQSVLGWMPQVAFEDGIARTIKAYRRQNNLPESPRS